MLFEVIYDRMHEYLLKEEVIHADETTVQVLQEPGRSATSKSYMWLYRTGKDSNHNIVLFEYQPSRSRNNASNYLEVFKGYIHTDEYSATTNLK